MFEICSLSIISDNNIHPAAVMNTGNQRDIFDHFYIILKCRFWQLIQSFFVTFFIFSS